MTVTKWIQGVMPKTEEEAPSITATERLRADIDFVAVMTGVEL